MVCRFALLDSFKNNFLNLVNQINTNTSNLPTAGHEKWQKQ